MFVRKCCQALGLTKAFIAQVFRLSRRKDCRIEPEIPISTLPLRKIIPQRPSCYKLKSPWPLLGGIARWVGVG